jgi:hypothetical protein
MISHELFYRRLAVCKGCEFWQSVCLKGHPLQSPLGCPVRKFDPVDAAGYYPDTTVVKVPPTVEPAECCGKGRTDPELKPMSWQEAAAHLKESIKKWKEAGYPMLEGEAYEHRIVTCKNCPSQQFRWFQCRVCRCLIYTKAKLATESCPAKHW